ncbi:MAG: hypothetical protein L0Y58_01170 [Verrucomicrobia subdivision 3 bacterium]|nr:hypothetical protein [Limisphaerales bacterium]
MSRLGSINGLLCLGAAQLLTWCVVASLATRFAPGTDFAQRPLLLVVGLLGCNFALYLASLQLVSRVSTKPATDSGAKSASERGVIVLVVTFAVLFRLPLWWSQPIQEIDIYRYLWDGRVVKEGVSPYRYSPAEVERASANPDTQADLERLVALRKRSPEIEAVFGRIDHREVPTVYPPFSQVVFAAAAWLTPEQAPVSTQVRVLKSMFLAFDLGTIFLVIGLLRAVRKPAGLALAYAWCPLVLKESANSGHMDAIAVCLTTATLYLVMRASSARLEVSGGVRAQRSWLYHFLAAALWAGAILAKLYPVVLAPLLFSWWWRRLRWRTLAAASVLVGVLVVGYATLPGGADRRASAFSASLRESGTTNTEHAATDPGTFAGLARFIRGWEMNDLLFSLVYENIRRPASEPGARPAPWYAAVPGSARERFHTVLTNLLRHAGMDLTELNVPFLIAQVLTGLSVLAIALWTALHHWPEDRGEELLRLAFLCLAWLWFLSATQNPWYWTWAMPCVIFTSRPWLSVSGFALIYYLRFCFVNEFPQPTLPGSLTGQRFFDEVVVWVEHLPVLLALLWCQFAKPRLVHLSVQLVRNPRATGFGSCGRFRRD